MLDELRELYQEVILDHGKDPRNFRRPDMPKREAAGKNPLCGDQLVVYVEVDENDLIIDACFLGKGCAISIASASMMTEIVRGKQLIKRKNCLMISGKCAQPTIPSYLKKTLMKTSNVFRYSREYVNFPFV